VTDQSLPIPDRTGHLDLHTHTNESDGTYTPRDLIAAAVDLKLSAIAITDHDTFNGYDKALPFAQQAGFQLIRGIELNTHLHTDNGSVVSAHLLGYFLFGEPAAAFTEWLASQRADRRDRNIRLVSALQGQGIDIQIEEVEAIGRSLTGRPHFARLLVQKGYASDIEDAFTRFVGEDAPTFIERQSPRTESVIKLVRAAGGIPVIAHPVRLSLAHDDSERQIFLRLKQAGLMGLEVIHSEHSPQLQTYYRHLADELQLAPSGGSDFHGAVKADTYLGSGRAGNVAVPQDFLGTMQSFRSTLRV
jgi:3',5'-nucleoside bisphosphate phosphatase